MTDTYTPPATGIKLVISTPQAGRLAVSFQAAAEKAAPGQPGKSAGEVIFDGTKVLVSLGKGSGVNAESFRRAGGGLASWLIKNNAGEAQIDLDSLVTLGVDSALAAICEGLLLGAFRFERYKSGEEQKPQAVVYLSTAKDSAGVKTTLARVEKIATAVNLARDWGHEPANMINPVTLAARVSDLAHRYNLKVTVIDDQQLAAMGAGAILSVGKGSQTPSRLILLEYTGKGAEGTAPLVVVGKALTFDSGGYSLKTVEGIVGMKYDKCGAMTAIGIVLAAAELGLKTPVTAVIGAAENMVSGEAYRPDDILTTLSGKTVEIISTDAEGRLVLADSLTYAQKNCNPRAMIDFATLTGGVIVALGHHRAGLMANNDQLASDLMASGEATYERLWRMPLDDEYDQQIKGDDADIKNSGGREAAPVIGGIFLKQFVDSQVAWAHVDIAGTATASKDLPYCQKGATGFGVRLVIDYLEKLE